MTKKYTRFRGLIAGIALLASFSASAYSGSYYKNSSVLSSGRWVKIKVTRSGMQQITNEQLAQWGFSDPSKVSVFGAGGVAAATENFPTDFPDDIARQPVVYTGDKLVFYGEADARPNLFYDSKSPSWPKPVVERNYAADAGYYLLTDSQDAFEPQAFDYSPGEGAKVFTFHRSGGFFEEEVQNYGNAGQLLVGHDISNGEVLEFNIDCADRYIDKNKLTDDYIGTSFLLAAVGSKPIFTFTFPTASSGSIIYSSTNYTLTSSPYAPTVEYSVSSPIYFQATLKGATIDDDHVSFKINKSTASNCVMQQGALDYFAYYYFRNNNMAVAPSLVMLYDNISAGDRIKFTNAPEGMQVWNVTNAYNVRPYTVDSDGSEASVSIEKSYVLNASNPNHLRLVAFNPEGEHNSVEYVGEVANQNLHAIDTPDLLIISSDLLYDYAQQLADLHRQVQGMDVVVLRQNEIFNEFGGGNVATSSIRRLAKMFYDRNPQKFRNLLIFGGGCYDNKGVTPLAAPYIKEGALVLTYATTEHRYQADDTRSFTADCYFGMLSDNFNIKNLLAEPMQINVGRIPARSYEQAQDVVNKIRSYLTTLPSVDIFHRAVISADDGDNNSHMENAEACVAVLENEIGGMTTVKAYVGLYPKIAGESPTLRDAVAQSFNMGTGFYGFSGHGKPDSFTAENIMTTNWVKKTEYDFYPFAALATCDSYVFDRLSDNITEAMVFAPHGGMIGVIGSCRTVYADRNQKLFEVIARIYGNAGEGALTGDIMRRARNTLISENPADTSLHENTMTYNFCGDPALPLYYAPKSTVISSVNGTSLSDGDITLVPGSTAQIDGFISAGSGVDQSFNGSVILSLYETPRTMKTYGHIAGDGNVDINLDEDLMCQTVANVVNGRFSAEMTIPYPTRDGQYNRLTAYAYTSDLKKFSANWTNRIKVDIDAEYAASSDTEGPEIAGLWINSTDFVSGDVVGPEVTALAHIEKDPSGLRVSTGNIGGNSRLVIDGTISIPLLGTSMTYNEDGSVDISWPVTGIASGKHTLTLKCEDNLGNRSSRSVVFVIVDATADARLNVEEKTGHTEFNFSLTHKFTGTPRGRIVIEDMNGNMVYTTPQITFDGTFTWDITDADKKLIPDGVYQAIAIVSDEHSTAVTVPVELVVIQKQ